MRQGQRIALIIPARNEQDALPGVLARVPHWVDDVIVVDNASEDRTAEVARRSGAHVVRETRLGYGAACFHGVTAAERLGAQIQVFLDADGSDEPREMARIVDPLFEPGVGLVVGCRSARDMPAHQRIGTRFVCALLSAGFGHPVRDLGPFRAIRTETLARLALRDRAFGWTAEMQARALRLGVGIREVPVSWRAGAGESEITGTWRGTLRAGRDLTRHSLREIVGARLGRSPRPHRPARAAPLYSK